MSASHIIVELENAIESRSGETAVILRQVTDLFLINAGQYSADQLSLYDDVFKTLVEHIEVKARAELAARLAPIDGAPTKTVRLLAFDDVIDVAGPILSQSNTLDDETLVECVINKGQEHLLAIATRAELSETVSYKLAEKGDGQVLGTLACNPGARFSNQGFETLVNKSVSDDWLAECVAMRKDIPDQHLQELLSKASQTVREILTSANPELAEIIEKVVPNAALLAESKPPAASRDYRVAELVVKPLAKKGHLTEPVVKQFADDKKLEEVIVSLAELSGLSTAEIEQLVMGKWSSPVAIIIKAVGFGLGTIDAIYRSRLAKGEVVRDDLNAVKAEFLNLKRPTAQRIMRFYQTRKTASS